MKVKEAWHGLSVIMFVIVRCKSWSTEWRGRGGGLQDHVCNCEVEQSVIMVTIDEGGGGVRDQVCNYLETWRDEVRSSYFMWRSISDLVTSDRMNGLCNIILIWWFISDMVTTDKINGLGYHIHTDIFFMSCSCLTAVWVNVLMATRQTAPAGNPKLFQGEQFRDVLSQQRS